MDLSIWHPSATLPSKDVWFRPSYGENIAGSGITASYDCYLYARGTTTPGSGSYETGTADAPIRYTLAFAFKDWPTDLSAGSPTESVFTILFRIRDLVTRVVDTRYGGADLPQQGGGPHGYFFQKTYTRADLPSPIPPNLAFTYDLDLQPGLVEPGGAGDGIPCVAAVLVGTEMPSPLSDTLTGWPNAYSMNSPLDPDAAPDDFVPYERIPAPTVSPKIRSRPGRRTGHFS